MRRSVIAVLGFAISFVLLMAFQACSDVGFTEANTAGSQNGLNNGQGGTDNGAGGGQDITPLIDIIVDNPTPNTLITSSQFYFNAKTDILFVLDDSCSMDSIVDNVRQGIDSVASVAFPSDTRIGVTYMTPVSLDSNGDYDFDNSWYSQAQDTPGHINLVSKGSVDAYLATLSDPTSMRTQNFSKPVCDEEWFAPDAMAGNNAGETCLAGAMQAPFFCTQAETGTLTFDQLVKKRGMDGERLFRDQANVHVIFVSDTHDAGYNFYGRNSSTPSNMLTPDQLVASALENSPGIQSLRFSGIVPVPKEGDSLLQNLNTIGEIPKNDNEARVNNEGFHNYSYLDVIKATQGVAMHAKSDDWQQALQTLVDFLQTPSSVLVALEKPAESITKLTINGTTIDPGLYQLSANGSSVSLQFPFQQDIQYTVQVATESK